MKVIKNFKADRQAKSITVEYRETQLGSTRYLEDYEQYSSQEQFETSLLNWANDYINGEAYFPSKMDFVQRINWLKQKGQVVNVSSYNNVIILELADNQLTKGVLSGRIATDYQEEFVLVDKKGKVLQTNRFGGRYFAKKNNHCGNLMLFNHKQAQQEKDYFSEHFPNFGVHVARYSNLTAKRPS